MLLSRHGKGFSISLIGQSAKPIKQDCTKEFCMFEILTEDEKLQLRLGSSRADCIHTSIIVPQKDIIEAFL